MPFVVFDILGGGLLGSRFKTSTMSCVVNLGRGLKCQPSRSFFLCWAISVSILFVGNLGRGLNCQLFRFVFVFFLFGNLVGCIQYQLLLSVCCVLRTWVEVKVPTISVSFCV